MRKNILNISVIAVLSGFSFAALAQDNSASGAPIFVTPYIQPTVTSQIPGLVTTTQQSSSVSNSYYDEAPEYKIVNGPDPWAGTSFGRITEEINLYDQKTGNNYNQYDYLALLRQRGEAQAFNETASYLQESGVFNPQKYQSAIANAANGGAILPVGADAEGALGTPGGLPGASDGDGGNVSQVAKRRYVTKDEDVFAPKRLHQAYDKDMEADAVAKPRSNQPIFLK